MVIKESSECFNILSWIQSQRQLAIVFSNEFDVSLGTESVIGNPTTGPGSL